MTNNENTPTIAIWLKDEDEIYKKLKDDKDIENNRFTGIDSIRRAYNNHINNHNDSWSEGIYYAAPYTWYSPVPQGIETDDSKLKPITVAILNWERHFYMPYIFEMYNNQDYPKKLIDFLIIDDDTVDKDQVLAMAKEQAKLYPDMKIRYIQKYVNECNGPPKRTNMAVRFAMHDIVVINETDNLPLGKNYLRAVSYEHSNYKSVMCTGIPIGFSGNTMKEIFRDELNKCGVMNRFGNGVFTFDKEIYTKIRGLDEKHMGWGGHEGDICSRIVNAGGKIRMNLNIYSGSLPNFPIPPKANPSGSGYNDWQQGDVKNDDEWGVSKGMKIINLYE